MGQIIFPSIMAKNQRELDEELHKLEGIVKWLHLDIIDGKFAPNHSLDFNFKLNSKFKYSAHLMVKHPEAWIKRYWAKVDLFIPQAEEVDIEKYIQWMNMKKKKVALALKPETSVAKIKHYLKQLDYVLILTVHPGFYGSKYLPSQLKKVAEIKKINPCVKVIVDGGMNPVTIKKAARAGADYFVSGSYVTKAEKPRERIKRLIWAVK